MAGRIMDLPNWSGLRLRRLMLATEARAWRLADQRPTKAMGVQAKKYSSPLAKLMMSGLPPKMPMLDRVKKAMSRPVNALGAGEQLQNQHLAEFAGVLRQSAGSGFARHAYADGRADTRHQGRQGRSQKCQGYAEGVEKLDKCHDWSSSLI